MVTDFGSPGVLTAVVWPPYVGLSMGPPGPGPVALGEPFFDLNYSRAQIVWRTEPDGTILGRAAVFVPKGMYTHAVFFAGPQQAAMMGDPDQFDQPVFFDRPGIFELDPIQCGHVLPRR